MGQLDRWNAEVEVYLEETVLDHDLNIRTRAREEPITLRVWLAPQGQSGTAARRAEQDTEGYETEKVLRMRLRRADAGLVIGAQSKIVWEGKVFSVFGDVTQYNGSPRTRHMDYTLRRA